MKRIKCFSVVLAIMIAGITSAAAQVSVTGELKQWHKVTLEIVGPQVSETDNPSPFLEYELTGIFTKGAKTYTVPGYFAADGNAANTGASSGKIWRIHFAPSETGTWNYTVRFRKGTNAAVSGNITAGTAVAGIDNVKGTFNVAASNKAAPDLRAKGCLEYVGEHHLRFANGEWFLKAGADSPENLLAYEDFDNTPNSGGLRKSWGPHVSDWKTGNPTWQGTKGKGLIGAVNYLSSEGMNTISFLTMNSPKGDDKNVFMWTANNKMTSYDCSKLDQWEIVMAHAEAKGMHLHFKTQETENELQLDNGDLGTNRKLYYRELIARFSHHNALNWNICEEGRADFSNTNQTEDQQKKCIAYFRNNDPYKSNVVLHTAPGLSNEKKVYTNMLGNKSELTGISIQTHWDQVYGDTKYWVTESAKTNNKWVVANDEQGNAQIGVPYDSFTGTPNINNIRKETLWGNLMAGGAGVEYYFGYGAKVINGTDKDDKMYNSSDMRCQDFRTREKSWRFAKAALDFFNQYVPFWEMKSDDNKTNKGWCLYKDGAIYVVYLPNGGDAAVQLKTGKTYNVKWYNPRTGGALTNGKTNIAGANVSIGASPDTNNDWVALVQASDYRHTANGEVENGDNVLSVSLNTNTVSLANVNDQQQLTASIYPASALNKSVTWTSSNTSIATVNASGLVTAKAKGNAVITVKSVDGNKTATATVTVGSVEPDPTTGEEVSLAPIHDAYLQGTTRYNTSELRIESNNRVGYLQFDLSSIQGEIESAVLQLTVGSDAGSGPISVTKGTTNNWTETNLSSSNKPAAGASLATLDKTYTTGQTFSWNLDASSLSAGGNLSLIMTQTSGNDVSFNTKEASGTKPVLVITTKRASTNNNETAPTATTDKVELLYLPASYDQSKNIKLTIRYDAAETRDVVGILTSPSGKWLGNAKATVEAGSSEVDLTIHLSDLPSAGTNYKLTAAIRKVGTGYSGNTNTDDEYVNITASASASSRALSGMAPTEQKVSVFPNPFTDHFTVYLNQTDVNFIKLYDTKGQLVYSQPVQSNTSDIEVFVENNCAPGLYLLQVGNNKSVQTVKLLKK
ncbi:hypothetical protein BZG02_12920 [Labilibaculum filiforme]|uniref:BIG2 domain-containing protein n=1 Tax=Labilibaculum filiforme TaxID=1940526 RepID=A0A2N3HVW2_9BACT|nr:DUF5060 domain-containing protein [Labilibaculum filiforme]PKQ62215.1 hypothetical protein BZG02_12920 [Labilibaculum filiforme]